MEILSFTLSRGAGRGSESAALDSGGMVATSLVFRATVEQQIQVELKVGDRIDFDTNVNFKCAFSRTG